MRLAAKLVLLFLVGMLLIVALFSYLTIKLDQRLAIAEHERHAAELADAVRQSIPPKDGAAPSRELRNQLGWDAIQIRRTRIRLVEVGTGDAVNRPSVPAELIIATREIRTVRMTDENGQERLYTYIPLNDGSSILPSRKPGGFLSGSRGGCSRPSFADFLLIALLGVATLSGLVIVIGGVRMVGKPLNALIEKVHRVGQGDFSKPVRLRCRG